MRLRRPTRCSQKVALALMAGSISLTIGCLTGAEFRAVAGPGVESGVKSIVNGVLDGLFAVIAPDASTSVR
jgi:hypothetical protein